MPILLNLSPAVMGSVLAGTTRAQRQQALVTAMGTGTQTVQVFDGPEPTGSVVYSGTFSGSAYSATGADFLPTTSLSSLSGSGGAPNANWRLRVTGANDNWWEARFGAGNVWVYQIGGAASATLPNGASSVRIRCTLTQDAVVVPPSSGNDSWLLNNVTLSTGSTTPVGDEAEVLFAGRKTLRVNYFWVTPFTFPFLQSTRPPEDGLYGGVQWHGVWRMNVGDWGVAVPELAAYTPGNTAGYTRNGSASMLQMMIRNYSKQSGWTDADYHWEDFDRWVGYYRDAGKKVSFHWYCVIAELTGRDVFMFKQTWPRISAARFRDALERVARRNLAMGRTIAHWEGPNEPDGLWDPFFGNQPGGSWENISDGMHGPSVKNAPKLAQLYRIAHQTIKSIDPDALISGGHAAGTTGKSVYALEWMEQSSAAGLDVGFGSGAGTYAYDWIDINAFHGYSNSAENGPAELATIVSEARATYAKQASMPSMASKPAIISEWMGKIPSGEALGNNDYDRWQWFNSTAIHAAFGAQIHVHFTFKDSSTWGDPGLPGVASRRAWRNDHVRWMTTGEITRIARTTSNLIRITKADGTSRQTGGRTVP